MPSKLAQIWDVAAESARFGDTSTQRFTSLMRGIPGHQKWVERVENDAKSLNDTLSDGIVESAGRRCGRFRFHLGNVGLDDLGPPLPGFDVDDCEPITGGSTEHAVRWRGMRLRSVDNRPVQLRLEVKRSPMYKFWAR